MKVAKSPLPLPKPLDTIWIDVTKIIDVFHFPNHVSEECRKKYSPDKVKSENPSFNTQAGEQTFIWVGRFKHILCSIYEQDPSSVLSPPNGQKEKCLHREVLQEIDLEENTNIYGGTTQNTITL